MLVLEALRAKFGDSLLLHYGDKKAPNLIVIDGGPAGVWNETLRLRLEELREERELADDEPLVIELMMVSHIDADHITGILDLMRKQRDLADKKQPLLFKVKRFWHNSFDDIIGNTGGASLAGASVAASMGDVLPAATSAEAASVGQGRDLRKLMGAFSLEGNKPFDGLAMLGAKKNPATIAGLKLTVVGPSKENVDALQKQWDKEIKPLLKKEKANKAEIAAFIDKSVPNLASIVVLAELDGKKILLTGDGRGDHTLQGLEKGGFMKPKGTFKVDVLKLPHHGSVRNVDATYFERIRAKHYVISADGKFDNPDLPTLKLISAARPDDDFTIHLTNPTSEFVKPDVGKAVAAFFAQEKKKKRKYKVVQRKPTETSIRIVL